MIEDIQSFGLDTDWPLSVIWLLSFKQNSFGWFFFEKIKIQNFLESTQDCFAYISATKYRSGLLFIQTERNDILYHLI